MKTITYMVLGSGDPLPKTMALDEDYDTYRPKKGVAYHFLILAVRRNSLYRVAMLIYETMLPRECLLHPAESQNRILFRRFLPEHYQDCDIVDIKQLDSVVIIEPLEITTDAT